MEKIEWMRGEVKKIFLIGWVRDKRTEFNILNFWGLVVIVSNRKFFK